MYYLNKTVSLPFEDVELKAREALKTAGFGVLTEIDMQAALQKKLGKSIGKYKILGACNPGFAYNALQVEYKIGVLLPCNVAIIENKDKSVDVSIMDPIAALDIVENDQVNVFAKEVRDILHGVLDEV